MVCRETRILSGIQEILLIVIIFLAIFFIPRITARNKDIRQPRALVFKTRPKLSGACRLAMAISCFWPLLTVGYFKPWQKELLPFIYIGIGPVAVGWCLFWILTGFKKSE